MTTTKYDFVRRAMYEEAPFQKLKQARSIKDSLLMFKPLALSLFLFAFMASVIGLILVIMDCYFGLTVLLSVFAAIVLIVLERKKESFLYNSTRRTKELFARVDDYNECLEKIGRVLNYYEIDSYEKAKHLKEECEAKINRIKNPLAWLQKAIYSGFVAVPLSAYIGYRIVQKDIEASDYVISVVLMGVVLVVFLSFVKWMLLISEGYYKDQYLLRAINEYEYTSKLKREE